MGSFTADLAHGESSESRVIKLLDRLYPTCVWQKANPTSKYMDILCTDCGQAIEVKSDRMATSTGNLAFEFKLFEFTKAETVFYVVGDRAYSWDIEDLKMQLLNLHARGKSKGMMGGDGWRTALILAPLELITAGAEAYELEEEENGAI